MKEIAEECILNKNENEGFNQGKKDEEEFLLADKKNNQFIGERKNRKKDKFRNNNSKFELLLYIIIITFLFLVLIFIFYYLHYGEYKVDVLLEDKDIIKPMIDMRKYKVIKLQNNIDVLLISDRNSSKCAASLSVGVGSFQDDEIPGLAHFTEHMIFLGSKSYPHPSMFEDHLSNHYGNTNAFTEEERTTFFFDIGWQGFTKALEMFSRMFAEPMIDKNNMEAEIEAINSENQKNINKDPWRENQVIKTLANKFHPYSTFSTGNSKTLREVDLDTLHSKVFNLYDKYYMPDNMKLVVLSNQNMEQLQQTVAYYFSDIRSDKIDENLRKGIDDSIMININNNKSDINSTSIPYTQKESGQIIWYQKISGGQHLDIIFCVDEIITKYLTKPLDYISYLLKYSGQGSLIEYLKKNKLATKLEVGAVGSFKQFAQYAISIYLTIEGLDKIQDVIQLVFNYINLIKSKHLQESTYVELRNISNIQFKYLEKTEKYGDFLSNLAGSLNNYKETDYSNILFADYIHSIYNETLIREYLNLIKAENSLIVVGSTDYPNSMIPLMDNSKNKTERWYGTLYKANKLSNYYLQKLNKTAISGETFKLRDANRYITKETSIVSCFGVGIITSYKNVTLHEMCDMEKADLTPDLAINSKSLLVWYKLDRTFLAPRINAYFLLLTPFLRKGAIDYLYLNIYFNYIKTMQELQLADAMDSGNEITLDLNENGISLFISSFTDLIEKIADKSIQLIFNSEIDENNFLQMVQITKNQIENFKEKEPYEKGMLYFTKIVKNNTTDYQEMLKEIVNISYKEFTTKYKNIQKSFYVVSEFYGNMNEKQLLTIESYIQPYLNQDKNILSEVFHVEDEKILDYIHLNKNIKGSYVFRKINDLPNDPNNAVLNFYQIGKRDLTDSLIMNLIELCWENMFSYNLRTVKQVGYIVAASKFLKDNYMYYLFLVQGSKEIPAKIDLEIDNVIQMIHGRLNELDEDLLNEYKDTLINELNKKNNNLKERSDIVWKEIYENSLDFNRKYQLIEELKSITKEDLIESFENTFFKNVKKLSIQIYSQYNFEQALLPGKITSEKYNLNPNINTIISDDLNILSLNN